MIHADLWTSFKKWSESDCIEPRSYAEAIRLLINCNKMKGFLFPYVDG
jgi:hypothetical protein